MKAGSGAYLHTARSQWKIVDRYTHMDVPTVASYSQPCLHPLQSSLLSHMNDTEQGSSRPSNCSSAASSTFNPHHEPAQHPAPSRDHSRWRLLRHLHLRPHIQRRSRGEAGDSVCLPLVLRNNFISTIYFAAVPIQILTLRL